MVDGRQAREMKKMRGISVFPNFSTLTTTYYVKMMLG